MNKKLVLVLLVSSMAVLFIAQNVAVVEIVFLVWRTSMSSSLLIFFTLIGGFVMGWSLHGYLIYRRNRADRNELVYLR